MKTIQFIVSLVLLIIMNSAMIFGQEEKRPSSPESNFAFADSLETAGSFQGAALVYKMIAELFPNSMDYAEATLNLGHLYLNPFNPGHNDSTALYWFTKHLEFGRLPKAERRRSIIIASLIRQRIRADSDDLHDHQVDSLTMLNRVQQSELDAQAKQIEELKADLYQTDLDLQVLLDGQSAPVNEVHEARAIVKEERQKPEPRAMETRNKSESLSTTQSDDQLQKLREIDLRALQRRAKR